MNFNLFIIVLLLLFHFNPSLFSQCNKRDSIFLEKIINNACKKVKSIETIEYEIESKFMRSGGIDTTTKNALCYVDVHTADSIFEQHFYIKTNKNSYLYNGEYVFEKKNSAKEIISYSTKDLNTAFFCAEYFLDGWLLYKTIRSFKDKTSNALPLEKKYLGITKINNQDCYTIFCFFHDKENDLSWYLNLYIHSESYLPIKSVIRIIRMGLEQYTEKTLLSHKINVQKSYYFIDFFKSIDKITHYKDAEQVSKISKLRLSNSKKSNEFQPGYPKLGSLITLDNKTLDTNDLKGKIVVIDFWYMSCAPCLKALPILKEIQSQYTDKELVILGINPMDSERKALLEGFLAKNNISYPIILANGQVAKDFHVSGYPTFFILDQKGIIQFQQGGYSEELKEVLTTKIDSLLGK